MNKTSQNIANQYLVDMVAFMAKKGTEFASKCAKKLYRQNGENPLR